MSDVVIQSKILERWAGPTSDVELRLTLDQPITTPEAELFGDQSAFVFRALCTINSATLDGILQYTLTIPQITIPATSNAVVGRTARYSAAFYKSSTGKLLQSFPGFESFFIQPSPSTQRWDNISIYNYAGIFVAPDQKTFTRSEFLTLLDAYLLQFVGWANPLATPSRVALPAYTAGIISNPPTQAQVQAMGDHLQLLTQIVAALIVDAKE